VFTFSPSISVLPVDFNRLCRLEIRVWQLTCTTPGCRALRTEPGTGANTRNEGDTMTVRRAVTVCVSVAIIFVTGLIIGRASERDETTVTVQVSSADHELQEGYFTLGDGLTLMVKPGTDLHRFLTRQRGRKVKISLTEATIPELSRLER
jgi:hypothetical protein